MKYDVLLGGYPFNVKMGQVEAPENAPHIALKKAKELLKDTYDLCLAHGDLEGSITAKHPVVEPAYVKAH